MAPCTPSIRITGTNERDAVLAFMFLGESAATRLLAELERDSNSAYAVKAGEVIVNLIQSGIIPEHDPRDILLYGSDEALVADVLAVYDYRTAQDSDTKEAAKQVIANSTTNFGGLIRRLYEAGGILD